MTSALDPSACGGGRLCTAARATAAAGGRPQLPAARAAGAGSAGADSASARAAPAAALPRPGRAVSSSRPSSGAPLPLLARCTRAPAGGTAGSLRHPPAAQQLATPSLSLSEVVRLLPSFPLPLPPRLAAG